MTHTRPNPAADAYLRNRVLTASPEELRLLLLEGAIKFARQGREGLTTKNYELSFSGINQCREIIMELITTIRPEFNPTVAENVKSLLVFLYTQLVEAAHEKDIGKLDTVIDLLEYERESWTLLMQRLAEERRGPAAQPVLQPVQQTTPDNTPAPNQAGEQRPRAALSLQA